MVSVGLITAALIFVIAAGVVRSQLASAASASFSPAVIEAPTQDELKQSYNRLPMNFEVNRGQADPEIKYLARGRGYRIFLTETEAVLSLQKNDSSRRSNFLRFKLQNARRDSQITATGLLPGKSNYLIGNDPAQWQTEIPNYSRVEYAEVYSGIGLAFYGTQQTLEYDFIVKPGADPGQITMSIEGAESIELNERGEIVLRVEGEKVYHRNPVVYQKLGTVKRNVTSRYILKGRNLIGFEIENYDSTKPLVIDPVIDYSTFFGGIGSDEGLAIAVDNSGNAYVTGTTYSNNFNTFAPLQTTNRGGKYDSYVTKINAAGSAILYSTYLGGSGEDSGRAIAVDSAGNAYIAGITNSADFNVRNAFQPTITGFAEDAFVTKVSAAGTALLFSTYLGGSNIDQAFAIALDASGDAYIAGSTVSTDFKTRNPLQATNRGNTDLFVTKIKGDGTELRYSTYLGGTGFDEAYSIAVDSSGNAYVAGSTSSTDFTLLNPLQPEYRGGGSDAFVTKINSSGSALVFSTYLGGTAVDIAYGIAVDLNSTAYVTGHTFSGNFNIVNALQTTNRGNADAFISHLAGDGAALIYSTYLGGSGGDFGRGIAVDASGNASIIGRTISFDFNTRNPFQPNNRGDFDAFVAKVDPLGSDLIFSTYLGGTLEDLGYGIAVDPRGDIYVTGDTRSTNFLTVSPLQPSNRGGIDAFVSKIGSSGLTLAYSTYLGGSGEDLGLSIALDAAGNAYITGYTSSNDFITQSPIQGSSRGGLEVFVTKILTDASDIAFNTYFGGNGSDTGNAIAVDGGGNCYITGATTSTNLPTRSPIQANNRGGLDAFVAKLNATGSNIIFSSYLGGSFGDLARGIAVDTAGNILVAGTTFSTDFPILSAFQSDNRGNGDAFVTRIDASGAALAYSSYLGGIGADEAAGIAVDVAGSAYVVGNTGSIDFNTVNPIQSNNNGLQDAFVTKVAPNGASLIYSTYLGGRRTDIGNGIAVDSAGNAYVTGSTASIDFNIQLAFQGSYGGGDLDAFVSKIDPTGSALIYSSYLGGNLAEVGNGIAIDNSGNCYVTGITASTNFPLNNPLQFDNRGGNEAFVTKINPQGSFLEYSTYLGASNDDRGYGIAIDGVGSAYITGATSSPDFPVRFPLLAYGGGTDVFVAKLVTEGGLALSPLTLEVQQNGIRRMTVNISTSQDVDLIVTLSSSNPSVASAPPSVTIPATALSAEFPVTGVAIGGPVTITATIPGPIGGTTATATVNVVSSSRVVQADSARVAAGGLLTLPIELVSQGNENRLSFSIAVDNTLLFSPQFTLGGDATNATLSTVLSQAAQGRYGITIVLPTGQKFAAGTRQILVLTAVAISGVNTTTTPVNFVDQPTLRRVTDTNGQTLTTSYSPGIVTIAPGYESDVAPRPNGSNGTVTLVDYVQMGRFAVGLDLPAAGSEFQRADNAPRSSLGNGAITISDWVQTGRFVAGLDPVMPAGGPPAPPSTAIDFQSSIEPDEVEQTRAVRIVNTSAGRGQEVIVTVECDAQGNENAFGFSINFDPLQMAFVNAAPGADASSGLINVNNLQAAQGRVGIALSLATGQSLAAGTKRIITMTFSVSANSTANILGINFADQPVIREVASPNADVLTATFTPGTINLTRAVTNVSAASFLGNDLARESIVAAFGTGLATTTQAAISLPLPTELGGTTVKVRDGLGVERLAPLFFAGPTQVNYLAPAGTALGAAVVTITSGDGTISTGNIDVTVISPALFAANTSGQGVAAATVLRIKADGTQLFEPVATFDSASNTFVPLPIDLGPEGERVFLIAFGTGLRGFSSLSNVNVKIGGTDCQVIFLGAQGDFVGLDQGNINIPRSLAGRGEVDVVMTVDGKPANTVKLNIR